jgi:hypothetical protein
LTIAIYAYYLLTPSTNGLPVLLAIVSSIVFPLLPGVTSWMVSADVMFTAKADQRNMANRVFTCFSSYSMALIARFGT